MMNVDYKKRAIIMSFICAIVIIALAMTFIALFQSLREDTVSSIEKHLYATVLETGNNYIKVEDLDSNKPYMFITRDSYSLGDLVSISYIEDNDEVVTKEIEVVASKKELDELTVIEEVESTTTTNNKPSSSKTTSINTTKSTKTTKTTIKISTNTDDDVVNYIKDEYELYGTYSNEKTIPEKAKSCFITIVDFIFYNGTIKGKRFDELTSAAKAKVIYYSLLIDNKIDSKWPDYKNTIKNKTTDLKAKLIAKYMDITSSICSEHEHACEVAKTDFAILKSSLNITWNVIKDAAKYGYGKVTTYLKNWYETWRDS